MNCGRARYERAMGGACHWYMRERPIIAFKTILYLVMMCDEQCDRRVFCCLFDVCFMFTLPFTLMMSIHLILCCDDTLSHSMRAYNLIVWHSIEFCVFCISVWPHKHFTVSFHAYIYVWNVKRLYGLKHLYICICKLFSLKTGFSPLRIRMPATFTRNTSFWNWRKKNQLVLLLHILNDASEFNWNSNANGQLGNEGLSTKIPQIQAKKHGKFPYLKIEYFDEQFVGLLFLFFRIMIHQWTT